MSSKALWVIWCNADQITSLDVLGSTCWEILKDLDASEGKQSPRTKTWLEISSQEPFQSRSFSILLQAHYKAVVMPGQVLAVFVPYQTGVTTVTCKSLCSPKQPPLLQT